MGTFDDYKFKLDENMKAIAALKLYVLANEFREEPAILGFLHEQLAVIVGCDLFLHECGLVSPVSRLESDMFYLVKNCKFALASEFLKIHIKGLDLDFNSLVTSILHGCRTQ